MTLLVTEIHNHTEPARAVIVFGADRRISHRGKYYGTRKKLFPIQRHKAAAIGYFGLAAVGNIPMDEWLRSYLRHETSSGIAEFAKVLLFLRRIERANDPASISPDSLLRTVRSSGSSEISRIVAVLRDHTQHVRISNGAMRLDFP